MDMTLEAFAALEPGSYVLLDIRNAQSREYGCFPGSLAMPREALEDCTLPHDGRKLIVYCARGQFSREAAEMLAKQGYEAFSLEGGYSAWLKGQMQRQQENLQEKAETSLQKKFRQPLWCQFTKAIRRYALVQEGDRIAVCISGGKDSMLMAKLFQQLQLHSKFPFEVRFLVMDPGYSPENRRIIEENARKLGVPIEIFESDIFASVYHVEKSPCYLCARMRRGHLYHYARELGCNKIALGHHYDDVIETTLMSMLYGGQVQTMLPKLRSANYPGMALIRPMYLIREGDIRAWQRANALHFLQCACRFSDASAAAPADRALSKRLETKRLIAQMKKINPAVEANIFSSMENVCLDMVLSYKQNGQKHSFLEQFEG